MKKYLLALLFLGFITIAHAQNASVEHSIWGMQIGGLGGWVHNEYKLSNSIALRSEVGLDATIFGGDFYSKTGYELVPVITLGPRWYYNLNKRARESKAIANNSGNFVSLKISYHPNWFVISNYNNNFVLINDIILSDISIVPTWSIRRNIGNHFNFETGIGVGYEYVFKKQYGFTHNESQVAINLNLRIGYSF